MAFVGTVKNLKGEGIKDATVDVVSVKCVAPHTLHSLTSHKSGKPTEMVSMTSSTPTAKSQTTAAKFSRIRMARSATAGSCLQPTLSYVSLGRLLLETF